MATILTISDGASSVSFQNPGASGLTLMGGDTLDLGPEHINRSAPMDVVESYDLKLKATTQDSSASQLQLLSRLLRRAWEYENTAWQTTPVFVQRQSSSETNARYAKVRRASKFSLPSDQELPFRKHAMMLDVGVGIVREHPWRGTQPGTLPAAETLTKTDGSVDKTEIHVANFEGPSGTNVDVLLNFDASANASANITASFSASLWKVGAGTPGVSDIVYIGGASPWHHFVLPIAASGVFSASVLVQAYISSAWTALTAGSQYSIYPLTTEDDDNIFQATGEWCLNVNAGSSWGPVSVGGSSRYYARLYLNGVTSWTTTPELHSSETIYTVNTPHLIVPSTAIAGDTFPRVNIRIKSPVLGGTNPTMGTTSRIIMGAKSRNLSTFVSHLNLGNAGNAGWTLAYGTDTSSSAVPKAGVGLVGAVTFATSTALVSRLTLTGTGLLDDYLGAYRVFLCAEQNSGAAGDTSVKARFLAGASAAGSPFVDTDTIALATVDLGYEVVDLGIVQIPFAPIVAADSTGIDLFIQVFAKRTSGSSTMKLDRLVLIPIDEWYCMADDNAKRDTTSGGPALRGNTALDLDFDVLANRSIKYKISGGTLYPMQAWHRTSSLPSFQPATAYRIYCLMMHYASAFGTGPFIASAGMHSVVSLYAVDSFSTLRGAG